MAPLIQLRKVDLDRLIAALVAQKCEIGGRFSALASGPCGVAGREENALAVGLLFQPGIRHLQPGFAERLIDFVLNGSAAAYADHSPDLKLVSSDPRCFSVRTARYSFTGDLSKGILSQTPHDAPDLHVTHTGNLVEFRRGGFKCIDVEDAITDYGIVDDGTNIRLWHESAIRFTDTQRRRSDFGLLRVEYRIDALDPAVRVEVRFKSSVWMRSARITTAFDGLDTGGFVADRVQVLRDSSWVQTSPGDTIRAESDRRGRIRHIALRSSGETASGYALHLVPTGPLPTMAVTAIAEIQARIQWLVVRYGPRALLPGMTISASETRHLVRAVSVEALADAFQHVRNADLSGLAMSGLASALYSDTRHPKTFKMSATLREACLSSLRHRLDVLQPAAAAGVDLAGAIVAVDDLTRADEPGFAGRSPKLVRELLSRLDGSGAVRDANQPATLLRQAMSVLALARLAPTDADAAEGLGRAILAMELQGDGIRISGRHFAPDEDAVAFALLVRACAATLLLPSHGHGLRATVLERTQKLYRHSLHSILMQATGSLHHLCLHDRGRACARLQVFGILALFPPEALQSAFAQPAQNLQHKPVRHRSLSGTMAK